MVKFVAIEGGGTTWVCAIAIDTPDNIIERIEFETTENPKEILNLIKIWLITKQPFHSIGIATFGPIDNKIYSNTYGYITSTPKVGWFNTNVLELLGIYNEFKEIPYLFDTDVNAPALAEFHLQSTLQQQASITSCAYITVGKMMMMYVYIIN